MMCLVPLCCRRNLPVRMCHHDDVFIKSGFISIHFLNNSWFSSRRFFSIESSNINSLSLHAGSSSCSRLINNMYWWSMMINVINDDQWWFLLIVFHGWWSFCRPVSWFSYLYLLITFRRLVNFSLHSCSIFNFSLIIFCVFSLRHVLKWFLLIGCSCHRHNKWNNFNKNDKMSKFWQFIFQSISTRKAVISIGCRRVMRGGCCCRADSGSSSSRSRVRPDWRTERNRRGENRSSTFTWRQNQTRRDEDRKLFLK